MLPKNNFASEVILLTLRQKLLSTNIEKEFSNKFERQSGRIW